MWAISGSDLGQISPNIRAALLHKIISLPFARTAHFTGQKHVNTALHMEVMKNVLGLQ